MTHYVTDYDVNSMYAWRPDHVGTFRNYIRAGIWTPNEWTVYQVLEPIGDWIESQPEDMWVWVPEARQGFMQGYALSPELEAWFLLKWE